MSDSVIEILKQHNINHLTTHSGEVRNQSAFFAVQGHNVNGNDFIEDADGDNNPCTVDNVSLSLAACQPILVRMYISMAKLFSDGMVEMLNEIATATGDIADGANIDDQVEGTETIS